MVLTEASSSTFNYFAFGSNLFLKRIRMESPSAVRKGIGYLEVILCISSANSLVGQSSFFTGLQARLFPLRCTLAWRSCDRSWGQGAPGVGSHLANQFGKSTGPGQTGRGSQPGLQATDFAHSHPIGRGAPVSHISTGEESPQVGRYWKWSTIWAAAVENVHEYYCARSDRIRVTGGLRRKVERSQAQRTLWRSALRDRFGRAG